jgi:acetyl-CoA acetyltransferase family protein
MALEKSYIPYGAYWSTPFCRWQGSLGHLHSVELAAGTTRTFLSEKGFSPDTFDSLVLGTTIMQRHGLYGAPWLAGMIGAPTITGPTVSQACATSVRMLATAAFEVELGQRDCVLTVACDRTSNGPHVYYPNPLGTGGMGKPEDPVWDNFNSDPNTGQSMIQTAENVAKEAGITREEEDALTLVRYGQYEDALADDRAFQRRYMLPVELRRGKKVTGTVEADEGVFPTTADGLAKLRPVLDGGTVTFGTQTYPADGNSGLVVCGKEQATRLGGDANAVIQLCSFGEARVEPAMMPKAVVPAARDALTRAGIEIGDCAVIKTHNPFAVNDVLFCRELGLEPGRINRYGSPLIWGHPQAPTGLRAVIEMIEELFLSGGGYGLFSGCAAGDTAMAVVVKMG